MINDNEIVNNGNKLGHLNSLNYMLIAINILYVPIFLLYFMAWGIRTGVFILVAYTIITQSIYMIKVLIIKRNTFELNNIRFLMFLYLSFANYVISYIIMILSLFTLVLISFSDWI